MHIDFTPEHQALRKEIRNYYRELFTPELRAAFEAEHEEMGGPVFREIVGRMGKDGWLGIGWPKEFGGKGFTALEQFIFWDETYRARAPLPVITVNTVGPMLMQHGSDAQKARYLPHLADGSAVGTLALVEAADSLAPGGISLRGAPDGGTTRLRLPEAKYRVQWYNPRAGGALQKGSVASIAGPGDVDARTPKNGEKMPSLRRVY